MRKDIVTKGHFAPRRLFLLLLMYVPILLFKTVIIFQVVYLVNSGTEANDLAVLLAKLYTGNHNIISLQDSYHGCSSAMLGLTSTQSYRLPTPVPAGYSHVSA